MEDNPLLERAVVSVSDADSTNTAEETQSQQKSLLGRYARSLAIASAVTGAALLVVGAARPASLRGAAVEKRSILSGVTTLDAAAPGPGLCTGGFDEAALNDFSALAKMEQAGWKFVGTEDSGSWSAASQFKPDIHAACSDCPHPSDNSYWGYDYPGNGHIELVMQGSGGFTIDIGNPYSEGEVEARINEGERIAAPARTISKQASFEFVTGDKLKLVEHHPTAIIVINSIHFWCPGASDAPKAALLGPTTPAPDSLKTLVGETVALGENNWLVGLNKSDGFGCHQSDGQSDSQLCINYQEEGTPWGSPDSAGERERCAQACSFVEDCIGFLYPDPGQSEDKCFLVAKQSECSIKPLCGSSMDLSLWSSYKKLPGITGK